MNTNNEITTILEALTSIATQAKQAAGHAGSYHVGLASALDDAGKLEISYWTVSHFLPGMTTGCTQGMAANPADAVIELVAKLGSPADEAKKLRDKAAQLLTQANALEAAA